MEIFAPLVGVSFRGAGARECVKAYVPGPAPFLTLEAEPENEYDSTAVKVIDAEFGHIGYIAKQNNFELFNALVEAEADERDLDINIEIVSFENTIKPVLMISWN